MQTILIIISILLTLVLMILILNGLHKHNSISKEEAKQLRLENESLRKKLLKHGIIEYI